MPMFQSRVLALRRIIMVLGIGSLVLCGLAAVSSTAAAKEKYTIDPITGIKYKLEPEMGELLLALAALGGKPIETLPAAEARLRPTMADAVDALLKKRGESSDPTQWVPDVTTVEATIPGADGTRRTATLYTPIGTGPFPAVVYFHGGGWVIGNSHVYDAGRTSAGEGGASRRYFCRLPLGTGE